MAEVTLKHKKEFEDILGSYQMSDHARTVLNQVNYVVMVGPAAAGRNTVINELVAHHNFVQVVSDTTRPPKVRDGKLEVDGENYFFRQEEELVQDLEDGLFLEAELIHGQQVSGTSIRELEKLIDSNRIGINEVEFGGAGHLLSLKPDLPVIALLPPSFVIWKQRFERRETITSQEYENRIQTFKKVLDFIESEPRVMTVVNHEYTEAAKHIQRLASGAEVQSQEEIEENQALVRHYRENLNKLELKI